MFEVLAITAAIAGCGAPEGATAQVEEAQVIAPDPSAARMCGGIAAIRCGAGQFCLFPHGTCGAGDRAGYCSSRPEVCLDIYQPVCGCDGRDYPSACEAHRSEVSVAHRGRCRGEGREMER